MKTPTAIDPDLDWKEHFARYGFAVREKLLEPEFIATGLNELKRLLDTDLPPQEWSEELLKGAFNPKTIGSASGPNAQINGKQSPVLSNVYQQPRLRAAIDELFGRPGRFNPDDRQFQIFIKLQSAGAKRELTPGGHIDFVEKAIPLLGRGFMFQTSLIDKEPFGGNITIWPGTHRIVQKCVMENPNWQFPANWDDVPGGEPFEFVPEAGDVLFFHHLVAHNGNVNATPTPRISLHCQALQDEWLEAIDPDGENLGPWERSLAFNGFYRINQDEREMKAQDAAQI